MGAVIPSAERKPSYQKEGRSAKVPVREAGGQESRISARPHPALRSSQQPSENWACGRVGRGYGGLASQDCLLVFHS